MIMNLNYQQTDYRPKFYVHAKLLYSIKSYRNITITRQSSKYPNLNSIEEFWANWMSYSENLDNKIIYSRYV